MSDTNARKNIDHRYIFCILLPSYFIYFDLIPKSIESKDAERYAPFGNR